MYNMKRFYIWAAILCVVVCASAQQCPVGDLHQVYITDTKDLAGALKYQLKNIDDQKGIALGLYSNNITELSPPEFSDPVFKRVVSLDVSNNELEVISSGLFDNLICLQKLNINQNKIRAIENGAFFNIRNLKFLYIRMNNLTEIQSEFFGNTTNMNRLKEFDASYNNISHIAGYVFHKGLWALRKVNLSHNALPTFEPWPYILSPQGETVYFDFQYNQISSFSNTMRWSNAHEMEISVDLRHNKFRYFRLEQISQYFRDRDPSVYQIGLLRLNLLDNPWLCDCGVYAALNLYKDSFAQVFANQFVACQYPEEFRGKFMGYFLKHPDKLICNITDPCPKGCRCQDIPHYGHIQIDCSDLGTLTELPNVLPHGQLLVNLSGNRISVLSKRSYLENITVLDIADNEVTGFHNGFLEQCTSLVSLDVCKNSLKTLPSRMQNFDPSRAKFHGNPLVCTCDSVWMNDWLRRHTQNISSEDLDRYLCYHGGVYSRIVDVTWSSLVCYRDVAVGVSVGLGILLVILILLTCVCWRHKYKCKVILFDRLRAHPFDVAPCDKTDEVTKQHDVYISIDRENEEVRLWVKEVLLKKLETKTKTHPGHKVYYPLRQDQFGDCIVDQMIENISKSRRVLAVVNSSYLQGGWSIEEFDHAHRLMEETNSGRLLVIIYGDLDISKVTQEPLKSHLTGKQCFRLTDKWVWRKLRYELPSKPIDPQEDLNQHPVRV